MASYRLFSTSGSGLPILVKNLGFSLLFVFLATFSWFNGLSVRSLTSVDFVIGLLTTGPFIGVLLYGGRWLEHSDLSFDRYSRIRNWLAGGLLGFLLLNVAMIVAWPAEGTYNNIAWALFAAAVGGSMGMGVGIFEAGAIDRAVTAERSRVKNEELKQRNDQLEEFAGIVSHDLRSPLSVAAGRLELLRQEYEEEHIDAVASAHDRMETIIERTLTLARSGQVIGGY